MAAPGTRASAPAVAGTVEDAYRVHQEEYLRYPHRYFSTALGTLPGFPDLPPSQRRYFYLDVSPPPPVPAKATLLLLHGFPDSSYGWRKCITPLTMAGYRVIVPDLLGYGRTTRPRRVEEFGARTMAADLSALMAHAMGSASQEFVVVGHDWGSWLAWKLARWIPERLLGVHGICVAYVPPTERYVPMEQFIQRYPQFGYQAFFEQPHSTKVIEDSLDTFLSILFVSTAQLLEHEDQAATAASLKIFGGTAQEVEEGMRQSPSDLSPIIHEATLLSPRECHIYKTLFHPRYGGSMDGPLSWYRTRKVTYDEERAIASVKSLTANIPYKMLCPRLDPVGQASLAEGARRYMPAGATYRIEEVDACGHWAMLEKPEHVVQSVTRWIEEDVLPGQTTLLSKITPKL